MQHRDFRRYWIAGACDALAGHSSAVVLPLLVLALGGSPATAGLLASLAIGLGTVVEPLAGIVADRHSRRLLMIGSDLTMAAGALALGLALLFDRASLPLLVGITVVESVAEATSSAAARGAIRQVLPDEASPQLSALQARDQAAGLIGPAVGGVLFSVGRFVPYVLNSILHAVTALCISSIRTELSPHLDSAEPRESLRVAATAGIRLLWRHPFLRFAVLWGAGVNAVFATVYYGVLLLAAASGTPAATIGLVLGLASGIGMIGALLAPTLLRLVPAGSLIVTTSVAMVVLVAAMGLNQSLWAQGGLLGLVLLIAPAISILFQSYSIAVIPAELQGRAGSVMSFVVGCAQLLAPLTAGLLAGAVSPPAASALLATVLAGLAVYAVYGGRLLSAVVAGSQAAAGDSEPVSALPADPVSVPGAPQGSVPSFDSEISGK